MYLGSPCPAVEIPRDHKIHGDEPGIVTSTTSKHYCKRSRRPSIASTLHGEGNAPELITKGLWYVLILLLQTCHVMPSTE